MPESTSNILENPDGYWTRAYERLKEAPATSSLELVTAGRALSLKARALKGDARKQALEEQVVRLQEGIDRLLEVGGFTAKAAVTDLRMQLAQDALAAGDLTRAEQAAQSILAANVNPDDWNYGNAIHDMNLVLAGVALERGNAHEARRRVLLAADSPGSPQLDSFGPSFEVVYTAWKKGDEDLMADYLERISKFWKSESPKKWLAELRQGKEPTDHAWLSKTGQLVP